MSLEQAVITELAALGPVSAELRLLARDRARRVERALADVANVRPMGSFLRTVAGRVAAVVREDHSAGIRVRSWQPDVLLSEEQRPGSEPEPRLRTRVGGGHP